MMFGCGLRLQSGEFASKELNLHVYDIVEDGRRRQRVSKLEVPSSASATMPVNKHGHSHQAACGDREMAGS